MCSATYYIILVSKIYGTLLPYHHRGLSIEIRNGEFPLKIVTCHVHIHHSPLVFHMETTFRHM